MSALIQSGKSLLQRGRQRLGGAAANSGATKENAVQKLAQQSSYVNRLRIRGLPFNATTQDVVDFFAVPQGKTKPLAYGGDVFDDDSGEADPSTRHDSFEVTHVEFMKGQMRGTAFAYFDTPEMAIRACDGRNNGWYVF